jgi:hypothetical protein
MDRVSLLIFRPSMFHGLRKILRRSPVSCKAEQGEDTVLFSWNKRGEENRYSPTNL